MDVDEDDDGDLKAGTESVNTQQSGIGEDVSKKNNEKEAELDGSGGQDILTFSRKLETGGYECLVCL